MTSSINSEQVKEFRSLTNAEVEAVSGGALVEIAIIVGLGALAFRLLPASSTICGRMLTLDTGRTS